MRHPEDELSAYVDGALDPEAATRVAAHLATCPACRSAVEDLRAVRSLLRTVSGPAPEPAALARVLRRLETPRDRPRMGPWAVAVATAAVAAALLLQLPWVPHPDAVEDLVQLRHHARITLAHPMTDVSVATFFASTLPARLGETEWER